MNERERAVHPEENDIWYHPHSRNMYRIHSVTDDGWTRYHWWQPGTNTVMPLYTQPTLDFINMYKRSELHAG